VSSRERTPTTPGRLRQAEQRRRRTQEILERSAQLIREKGFPGTTVEDVADQFDVTKAAIYYYVKDKQELLLQIHLQTLELALATVDEIAASDLTPPEKLRAFIRRHVGMIGERLDLFTVYFNEKHHLRSDDYATVTALERRLVDTLTRIYADGVASGYLRDLDPTVAALSILGMGSWIYRWYRPDGRLSLEQIAALMETVALEGMIEPPHRPKGSRDAR
jgi:TetR/AcrR family transcriptional regulator, cholesterol catabolism regulator